MKSRELHKPCVIGTKIATRVLKDGDEVEVDAKKGVAQILRRAWYKDATGSIKKPTNRDVLGRRCVRQRIVTKERWCVLVLTMGDTCQPLSGWQLRREAASQYDAS